MSQPRKDLPGAVDGGARQRSATHILFSTLPMPDAVTAVAQRLRTAMGLGLLGDGDRLPSESDLSRQLGVSKFALRGALGVLRDEGLITTRAGKVGGSFVNLTAVAQIDLRAELSAISTIELRDLGDWRGMLASVSASLAAQRASPSSPQRLLALAQVVAEAPTDEARRACGRFYVELAVAAQSSRMARAEFAMHEEFDRLLVLPLSDPAYRHQAGRELAEIAAAVAQRLPEEARAAAERHTASTMEVLMNLRLAAIAGMKAPGTDNTPEAAEPESLVAKLQRVIEGVMVRLDAIAQTVEVAHGRGLAEHRGEVSRVTMTQLVGLDFPVDGLGFIAEPSQAPAGLPWMNWWLRTDDGAEPDTSHVLDPNRDDFYDYTAREYFAHPRDHDEPWADGPYVDQGGVDDYVLTFARPVRSDLRFVGVAAADVLVADLESQLAPWLIASSAARIVINAERRVIVSNSATFVVGDVVSSDESLKLLPVGFFGWHVAVDN